MRIENLFWIGFAGGGLSLLFSLIQLKRLLSLPQGDSPAQGLAMALRKGTQAYLKWQLLLSGGALVLVFILMEALVYARLLDRLSPLALLSGGLCGLLVGAAGAMLTNLAGPRCAQAAGERLDRGVDAALSAGTATGFLAVGLGLFHLTAWFFILKYPMAYDPESIARTLLFFGLGSALSALLFRMGNLFARSAAMAMETIDRELGLPPDSPQDPAAVADRMRYGVGSAAGMASGVYCRYENILLAALFLGSAAFAPEDMAWNAMLLPLALMVIGLLTCLIGLLTIRPRERGDRYSLPWCLRFAALLPALLTAVASFPVTYFLTGSWQLCQPVIIGLAAGFFISLSGEYFTSDTYKPARSLAVTAEGGSAAAVTAGLGTAFSAAALPILLTGVAVAAAFWTSGGMGSFSKGLYGISLAGVGMLSVSGLSLPAALCGPAGDCAANTASLVDVEEIPRRRSDNLAAIGSSAANGGRCLAVGTTAMVGLVLLLCLSGILELSRPGLELSRLSPMALPGVFLGMLILALFCGLLLLAVQNTNKALLAEARLQFPEPNGFTEEAWDPDYAVCVTRCASRSLLFSLPPFLLALLAPPIVGLLLGPTGLMGFLGSLLLLCTLLPLLFFLSGGILSGARRYVESGRRGGRGSACHRSILTAERAVSSLNEVMAPALLALALLAPVLCLLCRSLILTFNLPGLLR